MPHYQISILAYSPASFEEVSVRGYSLDTRSLPDYVRISKEIEAPNAQVASTKFNEELWPILDALSFHRHTVISGYGISMLMVREDQKVAYLQYAERSTPTSGLHLSSKAGSYREKIDEVERLADEESEALRYVRLAMLATNGASGTMHLLQAVEALAGAEKKAAKCPKCKASPIKCENCGKSQHYKTTSKPELERIMGKELYAFYYKPIPGNKDSIRNALMHGKVFNAYDLVPRWAHLRHAVIEEIKKKHKIKAMSDSEYWQGLDARLEGNFMFRFKKQMPGIEELSQQIKDNGPEVLMDSKDPEWVTDDEANTLYHNF